MKNLKSSSFFDVLEHIAVGLANGVGYDDLTNMLLSVFGLRNWLVFLESVCFSLVVTVVLCSTAFVETYLYAPQFGLIMYNVLIGLETGSGMVVVLKAKKEKFDFGKALRSIMKPVGQNLVLFTAFNMAKASEVYLWLPITVWTIFTGVNFAKWLRNMVLLGALHGDLADLLLRQFSDKYQIKTGNGELSDSERNNPQI